MEKKMEATIMGYIGLRVGNANFGAIRAIY